MLGLSGIEVGSLKIFSSKVADEKNVIERIYFTKGNWSGSPIDISH